MISKDYEDADLEDLTAKIDVFWYQWMQTKLPTIADHIWNIVYSQG